MANSVSEVLLTTQPLEDAAHRAAATEDVDLAAGAVVDFWGVVRELEGGRKIKGIDYEAHQTMAEHQLRSIADAAVTKFQLKQVLLHHRIGFVGAGEASLFLRVRAPHRNKAFEASQWIVDELKKKVPIWKRPRFQSESVSQAADRAATTV